MDRPTKTSCEDIDRRIQSGEDDDLLFESIAECLADEVKSFAKRRCGSSRADIEDISQDAFLAAKRYLGSFRGEASLRSWLFRLVLSACSHQRRGQKNDPRLHLSLDTAAEIEEGRADPETEAFMAERLASLESAIGRLRPEDQRMLSEAEWEGMSLEEVAAREGLTVSAVKSRLFRIRKLLRELVVGDEGVGTSGGEDA